MWFWWFMFVCDLLVPACMIIGGRLMWKHCPENINGIIGYRTRRSMKNLNTWKFAHEYCGRLWWRVGWAMLIISAVVHFMFYNSSEGVIGTAGAVISTVECVCLIASILPTEKALKRNFTEEGLPVG